MPKTTEGFHLSPVDLEALPGIADICQGELPGVLAREIGKAITDACDPRTNHKIPRRVKFTLGCYPDADAGSAVWALENPVSLTLAAGAVPRSGRVVFSHEKDTLKARALQAEQEAELEAMDDSAPVELGVAVEHLIGGELDLAFKRASIRVYLDVDDGRKITATLRSIAFTILVTGDEGYLSVRLELKPPAVKLAGYRREEQAAQRLYVNRRGRKLVAQLEPDADLPGGDVGQQSAVAGTVTNINEGRTKS